MRELVKGSTLKERAISEPLVYLITDRAMMPGAGDNEKIEALIDLIDRAIRAGVDMMQIRERDLSARAVFHLASEASRLARSEGVAVLVNDRADIAASVGAGVHLTTRSMKAEVVRAAFGADMLIGVSTHNIDEAIAAERGGADFIVFGPVFETESKKNYGPPVGLDALREAASRVSIPVVALGGITRNNFTGAIDAGAAGIAAISLFVKSDDLSGIVEEIKSYGKR